MSLKLTDITQWNVGAGVLVLSQSGTVPLRVLIDDIFFISLWPRYEVKMRVRLCCSQSGTRQSIDRWKIELFYDIAKKYKLTSRVWGPPPP